MTKRWQPEFYIRHHTARRLRHWRCDSPMSFRMRECAEQRSAPFGYAPLASTSARASPCAEQRSAPFGYAPLASTSAARASPLPPRKRGPTIRARGRCRGPGRSSVWIDSYFVPLLGAQRRGAGTRPRVVPIPYSASGWGATYVCAC